MKPLKITFLLLLNFTTILSKSQEKNSLENDLSEAHDLYYKISEKVAKLNTILKSSRT